LIDINKPIDISARLDHGPWTAWQKFAVLLAALAIVFDGFDNQLLGFAIPAIVRDWHVSRAAFAPVVASGLVGMGIGAALAGPMGDRVGRRLALIASVLLFALATISISFAPGLIALSVLRFVAGAGIGGAMPNATAFAAEFAPLSRRPVAVTVTMVCVPLGGMIAGVVAAWILPGMGWRALFSTGGVAPFVLAVALWFLMPESPRHLVRHPKRWPELSRLLSKLGMTLPDAAQFTDRAERNAEQHSPVTALFGRDQLRNTAGIWITFLCCLLAVYTAFSWLPAMLAAQGIGLAGTSRGLAAYNFGGVGGALVCGAFVARYGSRRPMLLAAAGGSLSALATAAAEMSPQASQIPLLAGFAMHGFFVNGVQVSAFALAAHVYPTRVRATGIALALMVGRLGPLLSAFTGAALIQAGRTAYLEFLALSMMGAFCGLALVRNHIPQR